jgi:hypothetical protein
VFFGLTMPGRGMPLEYMRWHLAREFGWTLEYIDAMSLSDLNEYLQIKDGENRAYKG